MPILKSFLKDGEAESYQNVQVKFVPGRKAIMTIYESSDDDEGEEESWVEKEQVVLSDYKTKVCCAALHMLCIIHDVLYDYVVSTCTHILIMKIITHHFCRTKCMH